MPGLVWRSGPASRSYVGLPCVGPPQPKSPTGEFLRYILEKYPHLFEESVQAQLRLLCEARAKNAEDLAQVSESNVCRPSPPLNDPCLSPPLFINDT